MKIFVGKKELKLKKKSKEEELYNAIVMAIDDYDYIDIPKEIVWQLMNRAFDKVYNK